MITWWRRRRLRRLRLRLSDVLGQLRHAEKMSNEVKTLGARTHFLLRRGELLEERDDLIVRVLKLESKV